MMKCMPVVIATLVAVLGTAGESWAQDARWTPWLGCWERVTERVDASAVSGSGRGSLDRETPASGTAPHVCVERDGGGVTLTTTVPGQEPLQQTLVADGEPHRISEGACQGTERLEWSANGQRLFARAEVECAGDSSRAISGLAFITPDGTWLDIRSVRIDGVAHTRVSRYRRLEDQPSLRIPRAGSAPLTLAELKEASGQVTDAVLEAALVETNPRLPVRSGTLIDLAEAGVSPEVLDLIVALAYPEHFVVERTGQIATVTQTRTSVRPFGIDDYYFSGFYHPAYYYSPFGYSYIGYYDPFLFGPPYYWPPAGGGIPPPPDRIQPSGRARAIEGQGYTRIRPADEANAPARTARPRPSTGTSTSGGISGTAGSTNSSGSSSGGGGSSSGGESSTGGASPDGYSGGGGGGRTAQPR